MPSSSHHPKNPQNQNNPPQPYPSSPHSKIFLIIATTISITLFLLWKNTPSNYNSSIPNDRNPIITITSQDNPEPTSIFNQNTPTTQSITLPNPPPTISLEKFLTQNPSKISLNSLLNGFNINPQEQSINHHPLLINSEFLICPWNPSSYLLLIQIKNQSNSPYSTLTTLDFPTHAIQSAQLLGQPHCSNPITPNSLLIPPQKSLHYLFQITTKANHKPLTRILIDNDDNNNSHKPRWLLSPQKQHEPSNNARFTSLLAEFYLWKQQSTLIKPEMIRALAQECLNLQQNPAHTQAIQTILQQLPH